MMMADDFVRSVEDGLKLSKRIYFGKDRAVAPPKIPLTMDKSLTEAFLPKSPMVYAVISNPGIVDNPDIPSYQPHVHGRCDPPALIPLQMNRIELQADCFFDHVFVQIVGSWRVHCVMGSKSCDCRIALPMGEQGSILGLEVEVHRKAYATEIIAVEDNKDGDNKDARPENGNGGYLKPNIFALTIPKVDGGAILSIRASWMQKSVFKDGEFTVRVPFSFPEYVTPIAKKLPKKEKILLNVNSGSGTEIVCKHASHPLKEVRREAGKLSFAYETEVLTWTHNDFSFSYAVSSSHVFGGLLLQSPSVHDVDQREMFSVYLFPGNPKSMKVLFRKEVVFVIDISGSMQGKPIQATVNALFAALSKLEPKDSFNVIAFNGESYVFSPLMEFATENTIEKACQWINSNFLASGSTNISQALNKAINMVSNNSGAIPLIFLVTDGTVEDERHICEVFKTEQTAEGAISPRIHTFGIGLYCNHHFLRMLAILSRGGNDNAYEIDCIETRLLSFFSRGLSTVLANITLEGLDNVEIETYPSRLPDLSCEGLWTISGRYVGRIPDFVRAEGVLGDFSKFVVDLKTRNAKDIPLDKVFAKQQIDILTAQAWFSISKQLEEKVSRISIQTGVASEYTCMSILETERVYQSNELPAGRKGSKKASSEKKGKTETQRRVMLPSLGIGFGNLTATMENVAPGAEEQRLPEAAEMIIKAASNCCGRLYGDCCCMCCIRCCSRMNNQCAIALTQLCTALACFGCFECCAALCCSGEDQ